MSQDPEVSLVVMTLRARCCAVPSKFTFFVCCEHVEAPTSSSFILSHYAGFGIKLYITFFWALITFCQHAK